jgi:hypothetical protein
VKVIVEVSQETAWALSELTGEENLEDSVRLAIEGFIRRARSEKLQGLDDTLLEGTDNT